ncbi:MAG: CapA family protein [Bacillota bacterium]|nr:CapA family protein [Bacillota bacterium]
MNFLLIVFLSLVSMLPHGQARLDWMNRAEDAELSMVFIGDIMCHDTQYISCKTADGYDFSPWFEYMSPLFESADIAMANLETTITDDGNYSGYPSFRTPHTIVYDIKKSGIDILATANNHSLDSGKSGVEFCLDTLRDAGLMHVGTCKEGEENLPLIIEKNGIKLGIIASTYGANGLTLPEGKEYMLNLNDSIDLEKNIKYLKQNKVDGILYYIHWGNEYQREFSAEQEALAQKLFESGVNWIIGSHPHVIQGSQYFEDSNRYVLYSLGNVVSDQTWRYSDTGFAAKLYFKKEGGKELKLLQAEYHPFWVDKYDEAGRMSYKIIPILESEIPETPRLSADDRRRMAEALSDFREFYPSDLNTEE